MLIFKLRIAQEHTVKALLHPLLCYKWSEKECKPVKRNMLSLLKNWHFGFVYTFLLIWRACEYYLTWSLAVPVSTLLSSRCSECMYYTTVGFVRGNVCFSKCCEVNRGPCQTDAGDIPKFVIYMDKSCLLKVLYVKTHC